MRNAPQGADAGTVAEIQCSHGLTELPRQQFKAAEGMEGMTDPCPDLPQHRTCLSGGSLFLLRGPKNKVLKTELFRSQCEAEPWERKGLSGFMAGARGQGKDKGGGAQHPQMELQSHAEETKTTSPERGQGYA